MLFLRLTLSNISLRGVNQVDHRFRESFPCLEFQNATKKGALQIDKRRSLSVYRRIGLKLLECPT